MLYKSNRYWFFQLMGWGGFFLIQLFFAWIYGRFDTLTERQSLISRAALYSIIGLLITHLLRMLIKKINLTEKSIQQQVFAFLLLAVITALVCAIIEYNILLQLKLYSSKELDVFSKRGLWAITLGNTFAWFLYIFMWVSIYFMYHYQQRYQKQQLDTLQLKSLVKELELKTIKSHINPHFIFNALNSIRALVDENPERARNAITGLSNILRSSINIQKTETVTLKDELRIVEDYLALEYIRFEERLHVQYDIQNDTFQKLVPSMMLQLMTENAIKHGISQEVNGGLIKISSTIIPPNLVLEVVNTGHLSGNENTEGFGIRSTVERLHILYGNLAHFEIKQVSPNTVKATVLIPASP